MTWIVWTCGWLLTVELLYLLQAIEHKIWRDKPTASKDEGGEAVLGFVVVVVWIAGMIKFW